MAGLLTYPGLLKPSHSLAGTVAGISGNHHPDTVGIRYHSSGYCYGFSPYSLFIADREMVRDTKTIQI